MWTTTTDITVTPAVKDSTRFYFLRHTKYTTLDSTTYKLKIPTSAFGNITVPQLNNTSLTLNGRDSKIHVSDYDIGGSTLVYSTAEIFTWHKYEDKTVLVLYGGLGETHELVLAVTGLETLEGEFRSIATRGYTLINWKATEQRKVAKVGVNSFIYVYLLDRNSAYNYWSIDQAPHDSSNSVILRAGYLMRTAAVSGTELSLTGDLNTTQPIEILGGAPRNLTKLIFNNQTVPFTSTKQGTILTDEIIYPRPKPYIPKLSELPWKYISGLPELDSSYSDDQWTPANLTETHNSQWKPPTPTSLYASDYGYHAGTLLYRAHFTAVGNEKNLMIDTMGGRGFGASIWLNSTFVGSWRGGGDIWSQRKDFALPSSLEAGKPYVFTVVLDTMGLDQTWTIGDESGKNPRGILDYCLSENGTPCTEITWKLTGNLGGESYYDKSRGPLNEGGLYPERQGLHLPGAFASTEIDWKNSTGPTSHAITDAGIHFYATEFDLGLPSGYDIPLSFVFSNSTTPPAYRATIYVNGWQFGKYVSNIGPQTKFPVPEGILDYHGKNYLVVMVWALDKEETKLEGLELVVDGVVWSGRGDVSVVEGKKYEEREGAY